MKNLYTSPAPATATAKHSNFYSSFMRLPALRVLLILMMMVGVGNVGWGQSYLGLDGGLEGTATVDATFNSSAPLAGNGKWTTAGNSATQSAISLESSTVRSGAKSLKISGINTSIARVWTPCFTISSTTSKFFVQYYRRSASTTNTQNQAPGNLRSGTEAYATYATVTAADTWEKVTYAPGAVTAATTVAGLIANKANNATGGDVFIDDFCIYAASAVDNTAPNAPTLAVIGTPTTSSLDVAWAAASGGEDGGGYLVVRGTSDPSTAPNVNGIYAVGNTITAGQTVVYQGTGTSFTDNGLSAGTTYYYRVYTYDKAYNYSTSLTGNGTTSGGGLTPPTLTADATLNDVDNNIDISFADDATWRGLVTAVKIGGTTLTVTTDYVLSAGNLQLLPSGGNTLLRTPGSKAVTIEATGYTVASVNQQVNAGADAKLVMKTQPTAPAINGAVLAVQPAVYIQDQYGNTTTSLATVTANTGAGTWTPGGNTTAVASGGTATFSGLTASSVSAVTGANISFTSSGLTAVTSANFDIPAPVPMITIAPPATLTGFIYSEGYGPSTYKTFSISGLNLTNDISIAAATDYEISLSTGSGYTTSTLTLTQSGGNVASTAIYVRLKAGLSMGNFSGEVINITSSGASPATVTCSGNVAAPPATLPLYENFSYTAGQLLTANGWTAHSGAGTNPITVAASSITYPGYLSSGTGNEVTIGSAGGEDDNRTFTAQIAGTVYTSFLVRVSSASTTGDYFLNLGQSIISTLFHGRVYVKSDVSNNLAFGIAQSTTSANYTAFTYALNTTYLIVLKYDMVSGLVNDIASIYVNPTLNAALPTSGWITNTDAAGTDFTEIGSVALRQGSSTLSPALILDGIRISTNWADIVGAIPVPTIASFTPDNGCSTGSTVVTITGTNFTGATAVTFNGANAASFTVTDATTISATSPAGVTTGKIAVTTPDGTATSATDFTVTSPVTPTFAQLGPYCVGATEDALPNTSNNSIGITGTWSPATISTATAGTITYTFTPTGGQCATTATMSVTVNSNVTPTFAQLGPYCVGATADALPTTSGNGITGTWDAAITIATAGTTVYTFTPDAGQCATTATMSVVVNALPTAPLVGTITQPTCSVATGSVALSGLPTGNWTVTESIGSTTLTGLGTTGTFSGLVAGHTYTFTVSDGTCTSGVSGNAVVNAVPGAPTAVFADPNDFVTVNQEYLFPGLTIANASSIVWLQTNISGELGVFIDSDPAHPSFKASNTGVNTFKVTVTDDCANTANATITLYSLGTDPVHWSGKIDHVWSNPDNWLELTVPDQTFSVVIPANLSNYPSIAPGDNAKCNNITIESGASLLGNENLLVSGTSTINRYVTAGIWHYISAPNNNTTVAPFAGNFMQKWNEVSALWSYMTTAGEQLIPGLGYGLWNKAPSTYALTGAFFSGASKSTAISFTAHGAGVNGNDGANLLGNPYPCYLDWDKALKAYGAVYYWNGSGYDAYLGGNGQGSKFVAPMQGFFIIKASGEPSVFTINETDRAHNPAQKFYKAVSTIKSNSLVLQTVGENYSDKLFVVFDPLANEGFELQNDAYKLLGHTAGVSELYSYTSDKKLAIDVRPESLSIQLGFTNTASGEYQIGIGNIADIPIVLLEDTKTNVFHDLLTVPYKFSYTAGESDKRFILHFGTTGVKENEKVSAIIYSYQRTVHINLKDQQKSDIYIYNITGQLIKSIPSASGNNEILLPNTGNYIVKVVGKNGTTVRKVWIQ